MLADNIIALPVLEVDEEFEISKLPEGHYSLAYASHRIIRIFQRDALRIDFKPYERPGAMLHAWYRIAGHAGGRIQASRSSRLVRDLSAVLGHRVRPDRVPVTALRGIAVVGRVALVQIDHRQQQLAKINQYCVVAELLSRA